MRKTFGGNYHENCCTDCDRSRSFLHHRCPHRQRHRGDCFHEERGDRSSGQIRPQARTGVGVHPRRGRCLPHPQPRFRQAPRPDDDRHRQRHLAASVGGCGRYVPDVDRGAYPRRHRPPALFLGQRQVHRHRGHGRLRWRTAADLAGDRWGRPALDHLRGEGPRQRKARYQEGRARCRSR